MNGRPTAEIVADLVDALKEATSAADRLTELDADVDRLTRALGVRADRLDAIDALRPPCPACGGTQEVVTTQPGMGEMIHAHTACPDCVDGKASIQWMAAVFNAVYNRALIWPYPADVAIDHLRGAR